MSLEVIHFTRVMRLSETLLCEQLGKLVYGDDFQTTAEIYKNMIVNHSHVLPIVAIDEETKLPIGTLVMMFTRRSVISVELHVHPNYERMGVGSRLINYMHKQARGRKCIVQLVDDPIMGEKRQRFLDKHGYKLWAVVNTGQVTAPDGAVWHVAKRLFNYAKG